VTVLTTFVDFLVARKSIFASWEVPYKLLLNMMNENLRTFDTILVQNFSKEKQNYLLNTMKRKCSRLSSLTHEKSEDISVNLMWLINGKKSHDSRFGSLRHLNSFSNLQQLRMFDVKLACGQVEKLAIFFPKLR
jgi:hypothetical protein